MFEFTQEQVDQFLDDGYLAVDAVTTQDEVADLRKIYDHLFETKAGWDDGNQFDLGGVDTDGKEAVLPQILHPSKYAPELNDSLLKKNLMGIAKQIFGENVRALSEHMIFKPPFIGSPAPWHQDQAYHQPHLHYRNVNFWIPLQDVDEENGCMHFVPGSHKFDVLPHHSINNDPRIHGLEMDNPEKFTKNEVACPIPAGGATLHHSYMLHYSGENKSNRPRRAYILAFGFPGEERDKPLDLYWNEAKQTARQERADNSTQKLVLEGNNIT